MAGVLRVGVVSFINRSTVSKPLAKATVPALIQSCGISGRTLRGSQKLVKPKPYDYKDKHYGFFQALFDKTTKRLDENSKVSMYQLLDKQPYPKKSKF